jgi:hypothetical protein
MKKIILFISFIGLLTTHLISQNNIPQEVITTFEEIFPKVENTSWIAVSTNKWQAYFTDDKNEYSVCFLNDGVWKKTNRSIKKSEVPKPILKAIKRDFSEYKLDDYAFSETSTGVYYEFIIHDETENFEIVYDPNANLTLKNNLVYHNKIQTN